MKFSDFIKNENFLSIGGGYGLIFENMGILYAGTITPSAGEAAGLQLSPNFLPVTSGSVYGIALAPAISNNGGGAVTITNWRGIRAENLVVGTGPITVTNAYGIFVDEQTAGSTLNRSIFVAGGVSEFDGPVMMRGTSTNDNAAAGDVGELISSEVLVGSAVSLTSTTPANVTSISLTAGDWEVYGIVCFVPSVGTTWVSGWISTTSAAFPTAPNGGADTYLLTPVANNGTNIPTGSRRLSLNGTTTVYLSAAAEFASGTCTAYGGIYARRMR